MGWKGRSSDEPCTLHIIVPFWCSKLGCPALWGTGAPTRQTGLFGRNSWPWVGELGFGWCLVEMKMFTLGFLGCWDHYVRKSFLRCLDLISNRMIHFLHLPYVCRVSELLGWFFLIRLQRSCKSPSCWYEHVIFLKIEMLPFSFPTKLVNSPLAIEALMKGRERKQKLWPCLWRWPRTRMARDWTKET